MERVGELLIRALDRILGGVWLVVLARGSHS